MNRYMRRCTLGTLASLVSSVVLAVALGNGLLGVVFGTAAGLAYGLAVGQRTGGYIDRGMAAAVLGLERSLLIGTSPKCPSTWQLFLVSMTMNDRKP